MPAATDGKRATDNGPPIPGAQDALVLVWGFPTSVECAEACAKSIKDPRY
jgi:hypothetical protein